MKKIFALCAVLLLSSGTALAADSTVYSPSSIYNWSGLWIGGHAGYVSGSITGYSGTSSGPSGADVGVHGYYNFQHGNWVFGPYLGIPLVQKEGTAGGFKTSAEWAVTGGFRLGYAIDRWLPYGVIGAIAAGGKDVNSGVSPTSNTHTGYAVILGVDYALTDRWAVGARYAHVSLSKEKYGGSVSPIGWDGDSIVGTLTFKLF